MRVTLTGDLGSGKSSVGKLLAERLGVPHYSAGSLFREIGQIANLDALNTNLAAENNVDIDHQVDGRTREIDRTVESFVIDSRMAWHFVSRATRVYLSVSPETAAARIMSDASRAAETYDSRASALASLRKRRDSEVRRYRKLYGVDITDPANYDIVVITDDADVADIADLILRFAEGKTAAKFWLPKRRIVPMVPFPGRAEVAEDTAAVGDPDLPLTIAGNYGFFFDGAGLLASALARETPLVPYVGKGPPASGDGLLERAKRTVTLGDLSRWREAFAVDLTFERLLR